MISAIAVFILIQIVAIMGLATGYFYGTYRERKIWAVVLVSNKFIQEIPSKELRAISDEVHVAHLKLRWWTKYIL